MGLKLTIEVPLLLTFFSFQLLGSITTNLLIYRTCYLILGYNESECALLGRVDNITVNDLEKKVEPEVNIIDTTKGMVEQVIGLIICLFAGQWSDKFGRKPILLLTLTGMVGNVFIMSILSYFPNLNPWYYMIAIIPSMLTGGGTTFIVTMLSYIADISTEDTRALRMAVFEGILVTGMLLGNVSSSYLLYATDYWMVYAISAGICTLSLVYIYFLVPESLECVDNEVTFDKVFNPADVKGMFKVLVRPREKHNRAIILLITAIMTIYVFLSSGDGKTFLFLRNKFDWTLKHYTLVNSISSVVSIAGTIIGTYVLTKILHIAESVSVLMGLLSAMDGVLVRGLATQDYHIYFASVVTVLGGIISPQCRSLVAKLVPTDEIAKIFSLIMVIQFLTSIGAGPLYTLIYNSTVTTNPGVYNFVSAGFFGINIILILIVMVLENNTEVTSYLVINDQKVLVEEEELPIPTENPLVT